MADNQPPRVPSTTAVPLLWAWVFLIVYASLFPFEGWVLPQGLSPARLLKLPWPTWRDRFDEVANLLAYVPFGVLACAAAVRRGRSLGRGYAGAVVGALLLSYAVEVVQGLLPSRVPSLKDTAFNVAGSALGAAAAALMVHSGLVEPWQRVRDRWFGRQSSVGIALLLLWPVALVVPAPVPLGLGHVWGEVASLLGSLVAGTPLEGRVGPWVESMRQPGADVLAAREVTVVALGLAAPCLLAYVLTPALPHRAALAAVAFVLACIVTTLATSLGFGPDHALAWLTPGVVLGLAVGTMAAALCLRLPPRGAAVLAVLALVALAVAVSSAPPDPYYAEFLSAWERGRFVRFHGVAQWLAWGWPFAAIVWLLPRVAGLRR